MLSLWMTLALVGRADVWAQLRDRFATDPARAKTFAQLTTFLKDPAAKIALVLGHDPALPPLIRRLSMAASVTGIRVALDDELGTEGPAAQDAVVVHPETSRYAADTFGREVKGIIDRAVDRYPKLKVIVVLSRPAIFDAEDVDRWTLVDGGDPSWAYLKSRARLFSAQPWEELKAEAHGEREEAAVDELREFITAPGNGVVVIGGATGEGRRDFIRRIQAKFSESDLRPYVSLALHHYSRIVRTDVQAREIDALVQRLARDAGPDRPFKLVITSQLPVTVSSDVATRLRAIELEPNCVSFLKIRSSAGE